MRSWTRPTSPWRPCAPKRSPRTAHANKPPCSDRAIRAMPTLAPSRRTKAGRSLGVLDHAPVPNVAGQRPGDRTHEHRGIGEVGREHHA